ncbi:TolC family protein [Crateriforma conspicua]|uniref:Outer membrane efflux protein n=1 Tax=Crateriforma conspicua TaxID=2527996 RepID=A0A5C5XR52_9PLAN|nr:hypothetical protein [Crateriforma conspicua]TWT65697.1 Outer membrane efflux protein [Crateriforma conspicua]
MHLRMILSILVAITAGLLVIQHSDADNQPSNHEANSNDMDPVIRKLLTERRDTYKSLVEIVNESYLVGRAEHRQLIQVQNDLLQAELDLATTRSERLKIHQQLVDNLQAYEKLLEARFANGTTQQTDVLSTKADRLKAEVALRRLQLQDE